MASGIELAKAYIQILPSMDGIKKLLKEGLDESGESAGKSAGEKSGKSFIDSFKKTLVTLGIGKIIKEAFNEGMDLQQSIGGTEAVFGDFADSIKEKAAEAFNTMGMSANEYMESANLLGSLFQGSGFDQSEAFELTTSAMQRAADVASIMGISTESAMQAIQGAAKNNFTMMDNLGVAMNATSLAAYAESKGMKDFVWETASYAQKASLAMEMFMDRTEQYAGNFEREAGETLSGSLGAMQSAVKNLLGNLTLGEDISGSLDDLESTLGTFITNHLLPTLINLIGRVPQVLGTLLDYIPQEILPAAISTIGTLTESLIAGLPELVGQILNALPDIASSLIIMITDLVPQIIAILPDLISSVMDFLISNLPQFIIFTGQSIATLLTGLIDSLPMIIDYLPTLFTEVINALIANIGALMLFIKEVTEAVVEALPTIIDAIITVLISNLPLIVDGAFALLIGIVQAIPLIVETLIKNLPVIAVTIVTSLMDAIPDLISVAGEMIRSLYLALQDALDAIWDSIMSIGLFLVEGIWNGISSSLLWIKDKISGWVGNVLDFIKNLFGIHSPSKETAWMGGMLTKGLAEGMKGGKGELNRAIEDITRMTTGTMSSGLDINARARQEFSYGFDNVEFNGGIIAELRRLGDRMEKMRVVLDSGKTVGGLLSETDEQLGVRQKAAARGVV